MLSSSAVKLELIWNFQKPMLRLRRFFFCVYMPLTKNVSKNIKELYEDNKKTGKNRGANGKKRSRKQIIAIAMSKRKMKSMEKKMVY